MADRDLNFSPQVTQVTPKLPDFGLEGGIAQFADQVANMSAQAKALNASAQTALAFRQLDGQFRMQNAGDPNNPQALSDLQSQRAAIVNQIGGQVPAIASRDYMMKAIELGQSSDKMNELWATHQQMRNAVNDLDVARHTQLGMANMEGQQFASTGGTEQDLGSALNYVQAGAAIKQFATPVIGDAKTDDYLKAFNSDYVKSFVAGVAGKNPQLAAALLQKPEIATNFTTQDIGDMADVIKKTQRQQQLIQQMQITHSDGQLTDIVNDPNTSYFDKRAAIDKLDMEGAISSKAASSARRVIKSVSDADAQTDTPMMTDIVNKAYDLNANTSTSPDDYLVGVQNLHNEVLDAQAQGKLTAQDAQKLTRQVNDLTSKKMADATNTAGMEFYDANQQFNALPVEYRGQATRALFYAGYGQNWNQQQYKNQAVVIMQQINDKRRAQAQGIVNGLQSDSEFLKTIPNATPEAIQATAQKYGISTAAVIQQLRANAAAQSRAKASGIKRVAPQGADEEDDKDEGDKDLGIKFQGPAPRDEMEDEEQELNQ